MVWSRHFRCEQTSIFWKLCDHTVWCDHFSCFFLMPEAHCFAHTGTVVVLDCFITKSIIQITGDTLLLHLVPEETDMSFAILQSHDHIIVLASIALWLCAKSLFSCTSPVLHWVDWVALYVQSRVVEYFVPVVFEPSTAYWPVLHLVHHLPDFGLSSWLRFFLQKTCQLSCTVDVHLDDCHSTLVNLGAK